MQCRDCKKAAYAKNRAHILEQKQEYLQKNRERIAAYKKEYAEKNHEKIRQRSLDYRTERDADPERRQKFLEYQRNYMKLHPDKNRAWFEANKAKAAAASYKRWLRKRANGGSFSDDEWAALKAKYDHCCLCCGKKEPDIVLSPDHIIPVSKGGHSNIDNIQPLCPFCNNSKGNKTLDYRP